MSKEIKRQIDELNEKVENIVDPTSFILNPTVVDLMWKISKLQEQCEHHFIEGVCEYCYMEEN